MSRVSSCICQCFFFIVLNVIRNNCFKRRISRQFSSIVRSRKNNFVLAESLTRAHSHHSHRSWRNNKFRYHSNLSQHFLISIFDSKVWRNRGSSFFITFHAKIYDLNCFYHGSSSVSTVLIITTINFCPNVFSFYWSWTFFPSTTAYNILLCTFYIILTVPYQIALDWFDKCFYWILFDASYIPIAFLNRYIQCNRSSSVLRAKQLALICAKDKRKINYLKSQK